MATPPNSKYRVPAVFIFADGASSGNPGPSGWGTVLVTSSGEVTELGGFDPLSTNNRMELMAVIRGLARAETIPGEVDVYTDSVYVIRGITQWIWGWRKNGWKTADGKEVSNPDLWKMLSAELAKRGKENPVKWHFVRGHSGIPGNERVDEIAVGFSKGPRPKLYSGPLLGYSVAIHDIPEDTSLPAPREKSGPKPQAYSYLSVVGNTPMRHKTWPSCERRVKGQSGAKFKKAMSASEEATLLQAWGFDPSSVRSDET